MGAVVHGVYNEVASKNLQELREEVPVRDVKLKKMKVYTGGCK